MADAPPDYPTLTGAQFRRAVGADPGKWADAFIACAPDGAPAIADWFRDAMVAAASGAEYDPEWPERHATASRSDPREG